MGYYSYVSYYRFKIVWNFTYLLIIISTEGILCAFQVIMRVELKLTIKPFKYNPSMKYTKIAV